uniref:Uncharacterized protein n=1 Tax=Arundo donax TaxID=35708 RepID=A0A0A8ZPT1_ARUDO
MKSSVCLGARATVVLSRGDGSSLSLSSFSSTSAKQDDMALYRRLIN